MRPTLVDEVRDASGHEVQTLHPEVTGTVPASASNLMAVREGMREEINRPYNMNYWFRAAGVPADGGGKTGTAQWGGSGLDLPTHAWFLFFAPYAQPGSPFRSSSNEASCRRWRRRRSACRS